MLPVMPHLSRCCAGVNEPKETPAKLRRAVLVDASPGHHRVEVRLCKPGRTEITGEKVVPISLARELRPPPKGSTPAGGEALLMCKARPR